MAAMYQLYQKQYTSAEKQHSEDWTEGDALADKGQQLQQSSQCLYTLEIWLLMLCMIQHMRSTAPYTRML